MGNLFKNEPITFLFGKMWRFSEGARGKVVLYIFLFIVANSILLIDPLVFGFLINEIQKNGVTDANLPTILFWCAMMLAVNIGFWIFHGTARVIERVNAFRVKNKYQEFLLKNALSKNLLWHQVRDSGDLLDKINKSRDALFAFSEDTFIILQIVVKIIGTALALCFFNYKIAIGVMFFVFVCFYIIWQFDRRLVKQYAKLNVFENEISAKFFDSISNITTVLILRIQKAVTESLVSVFWKPHEVFVQNSLLNEWKWFTGDTIFRIVLVVPLGLYIYFNIGNTDMVSVGAISTLYLYLSQLVFVYFSFAGSYERIIINRTRVLNAEELEDEELSSIATVSENEPIKSLRISNLSFAYSKDDAPAVAANGIHFTQGQKVALIGESGSGKTTFLKVLHGLYVDATGEFTINKTKKVAIGEHDIGTMLVPQEPELFSATIRENITLGLDYSDEQILEFVGLAQFKKVLDRLPKGLESVVNEKGVNLSGGEKQRLALARALLFAEKKQMILLDESTSSVDAQNEVAIYKNIFEKFPKTIIVASIHKLNLLKYFDHIIRFESGKLIDQGSLKELCERDKKFGELFEEYRK